MLTLSNHYVVLVANYMVRDFVNASIEINTVFCHQVKKTFLRPYSNSKEWWSSSIPFEKVM